MKKFFFTFLVISVVICSFIDYRIVYITKSLYNFYSSQNENNYTLSLLGSIYPSIRMLLLLSISFSVVSLIVYHLTIKKIPSLINVYYLLNFKYFTTLNLVITTFFLLLCQYYEPVHWLG